MVLVECLLACSNVHVEARMCVYSKYYVLSGLVYLKIGEERISSISSFNNYLIDYCFAVHLCMGSLLSRIVRIV